MLQRLVDSSFPLHQHVAGVFRIARHCLRKNANSATSSLLQERAALPCLALSGTIATWTIAVHCDDEVSARKGPCGVGAAASRRSLIPMLKEAGVDAEVFLASAAGAYYKAAGPDGVLRIADVNRAVNEWAEGFESKKLLWTTNLGPKKLKELGPLLFRMLDVDKDETVTLQEFLFGQALILTAARAKGPEQLGELCWHALDVDGNGSLDRVELTQAVRVMVVFGALNPKFWRQYVGDQNVGPGQKRNRVKYLSVEEVVSRYMDIYDVDHDGKITRAEFSRHSHLQENFWRLLNSAEAGAMIMVEPE